MRRAKNVASVMVGLMWPPLTGAKQYMNKVRKSQLVIPPTREPKKAAVPKTPAEPVAAGAKIDDVGLGWIAIQPVMKMSRNDAAHQTAQ